VAAGTVPVVRALAVVGLLTFIFSCHSVRVPPQVPSPAPALTDAGVAEPLDAGQAALPPEDAGYRVEEVAPAETTSKLEGLPPPPNDALNQLYTKRLDFRHGSPTVPTGIAQGVDAVTFSPRARMRLKVRGAIEKIIDAPGNSVWSVHVVRSEPALVERRLLLAELPHSDKRGLAREEKLWSSRGVTTRTETTGALYGVAGNVIDNRRYFVLMAEALDEEALRQKQKELFDAHGVRASVFETVRQRPSGILEVRDAQGASVALGEDWAEAEVEDDSGVLVRQVEYGMGYDFHGFEDRTYRGSIQFTIDQTGKLAVVNVVTLETLLFGLVPSEIFPRAHAEALKAQAVTARGEVLAKVGTKHLADPFLLCAEQHCAVYRGQAQETPSTTAAVEATRGEGLFAADGRLVDSVYSAVCGGHSENNEAVWGGPPNKSLRGKPDLLGRPASAPKPLKNLAAYLATPLDAACRLSSFAQPSKYRWEKRFTAQEVDALAAPLGLGKVLGISVDARGVSGRATSLTLSGEQKATQLRGELNIRRFFRMLNSAMFVVTPERDPEGTLVGWVFRGGGWGHGVGMCQTGAIGRAEAGHSYRAILRHYFNGAHVAKLY